LLVPSWVLLGLVSAALSALVAVFGKLGLSEAPPIPVAMARALIMAAVVAAATVVTGQVAAVSAISTRAWVFIVLSGVAGAGAWVAYFAALQAGQASAVSALDRLSIVFVVVFAALVLGEALTWEKALGASLVVAGAFLITR
jgi:transporter family protein